MYSVIRGVQNLPSLSIYHHQLVSMTVANWSHCSGVTAEQIEGY